MTLIGFNCRTVDFVPQGLLENVRNPLVVHSQIWLLGAGAGALAMATGVPATAAETGAAGAAGAGVSAPAAALKVRAKPAKIGRIMPRRISITYIIAQSVRQERLVRHRLVTTR
jgi:hypothetical protein